MNIIKNVCNDCLNVSLSGRLDTTTAPDLEKALSSELDKVNSIVIDFKELEYVSSAGLRVLLATHKTMVKKGGMILENVKPEIVEVFEMTGFSDFLTIR